MGLKILNLGQTFRKLQRQLRHEIPGKEENWLEAVVGHIYLAFEFSWACLGVKEGVNRSAEKREKQNQKNPGQLIGGFFFFVQNVKTYNYAEPLKNIINIVKSHKRAGDEKEYKSQLNHKQKNDKNPPPEDDPKPFFLHLSYTGHSPAPCLISCVSPELRSRTVEKILFRSSPGSITRSSPRMSSSSQPPSKRYSSPGMKSAYF